MKRIILAALLSLLIIPAAASARTPVSGGLKQTIGQSFVQSNQSIHLHVSTRQISGCFDVYTVRSYAYVTISYQAHPSWFRPSGRCDIKDE